MSIPGLTFIGESINDSVPSTHKLFEANDIEGIVGLAQFQADRGAAYIDVNVGPRSAGFMADVVKHIQQHISLPLAIDTPDPELAAAGLEVYDSERAGNKRPILNSISEGRLDMFDLYDIQPFIPILLVTEGKNDDGDVVMNQTAKDIYTTATSMVGIARDRIKEVKNDQLILDPGIMPIGSDSRGDFKRLMTVLNMIHAERDFTDINMSVGISNFTQMLPSKKPDGSPVKGPLESAFLTMAMPLGLNTVIGSVRRKYSLLSEDHPAMQCLNDVLGMDGVEGVMRVMMYVS
jgi:cobalamin-dependent methionine synthase I